MPDETARGDAAGPAPRLEDVFLATMSHELRTPLNSIIGFSDVLLSGIAGELNAEQRTQIAIINESGQQLLALISDALDILKLEAGQLALRPEPVALEPLLREQVRILTLQARDRGIEVRLELPPEPVVVHADAQRLRQVFGHLVANALKFTDRGAITLCAESDAQAARISVHDTGIGIPPEDLDRLFRPFQRVAGSHGGARDGSGLGLAIARRLVEAMGGQIGVTSEPGQGSRFWLTLPLA
jgi:signal transduction histidine kinase